MTSTSPAGPAIVDLVELYNEHSAPPGQDGTQGEEGTQAAGDEFAEPALDDLLSALASLPNIWRLAPVDYFLHLVRTHLMECQLASSTPTDVNAWLEHLCTSIFSRRAEIKQVTGFTNADIDNVCTQLFAEFGV